MNYRETILDTINRDTIYTPTPKPMVETEFNVHDFAYTKHNAGFITEAAKRMAKGEVVRVECYRLVKQKGGGRPKYRLEETINIGVSSINGNKALRMSHSKDLTGPGSESIISTPYSSIASDPVAIGVELVYYVKAYGYEYVREQPKK